MSFERACALALLLAAPALAHGGHLELRNFYLERKGEHTQLYGEVRYPDGDTPLALEGVSGATFSASFEQERNGRWQKVARIPVGGTLRLNASSDHRITLPASFDLEGQRGTRLPISFLFGQGGIQVLEVQVGKPTHLSPWAAAGLVALGLVLGVLGRLLLRRRVRRRGRG